MDDHARRVVQRFVDAVARVRLGTERGQWMSDVGWPTWDRWFDLDVIVHAMSGSVTWADPARGWRSYRPRGPGLPDQLPVGVEWKRAIPEALRWAAATPNAVAVLERLQCERADQWFGPLPEPP